MSHVLFVCIQNAGRSQIAQALFERAAAAGTRPARPAAAPAPPSTPQVVEAMRELGIDLAGRVPQRLDARHRRGPTSS